jgi:hypothetical protein
MEYVSEKGYSMSRNPFLILFFLYAMNRRKHSDPAKSFPYYQIQYWDEFSICWANFHRSFDNPQTADNFAITVGKRYRIGSKYRIIEVTASGRSIIKTVE